LVDRIVTISLYLPRPEKNSSSSRFDWKKWGIKRKSTPGLIEESENIRQPVLYLYGTGGFNQQSVADSLKLLQEVLPQIWIIALEGGIFQRLLKNPGEVVSLITKFLNSKLESSL